ncbi:MAG: hypothetical protein L0154_12320 [Chloroflexi bacterium]|nr:hypothetical protein [Chloroflexota bacterium]
MKVNWKVLVAVALIVVTIFLAVNSTRPRSYNGANLSFGIGGGEVTVMNPSEAGVPVQIVSTGSRTFRIASTIDDVSGNSTRQGSGRSITHLYEFELPSGISAFTITNGTNATFATSAETDLEAIVNPVSEGTVRTTLIAATVFVLGLLYYISNTTGHRWMSVLRGNQVANLAVKPLPISANLGQGRIAQSYGDNRTQK